MDLETIDSIKRLAIIAMFSDDDLMERFVLKGGNAMDIVHGVADRASMDLDFSIEDTFTEEELDSVKGKIGRCLTETFEQAGFKVFDITLMQKPSRVSSDMADFWGGYEILFKIIEAERHKAMAEDIELLRRNALVVGWKQRTRFTIQISKFEYCQAKQRSRLGGYTIYVYSPEMIVFEKIRTICQQMPEYLKRVKSRSGSARARDFLDIHLLMEHFGIDIATPTNIQLLKSIFEAKRVPLSLIGEIEKHRDYHREDFPAVKDTVKPGRELKEFDFYFDYVVDLCRALKPLWDV